MREVYTAQEIIAKKRDGIILTQDEIKWFVSGIFEGYIADFQITALLMAIYINGCNKEETSALTEAMLYSGSTLSFNDPKVIDKHSTGGVGDKTSLILGPIAAACGVKIPMISGRGLGHTGGTIDKMESIPGFKTELSIQEYLSTVNQVGIAIVGQSEVLVPADKIIYKLRDLTATVASIPLITASIMSKKLAEDTSGLVMDIKFGQGAFMKTKNEAQILAKCLRDTALSFQKNILILLTDMSQPLGQAIGNSNEVIESIETLKGKGPADVTELSIELAAGMVYLAKITRTMNEARLLASEQINNGQALKKFREMIEAQGGNSFITEDYSLLPQAAMETKVLSIEEGFITSLDVVQLGLRLCDLGGGRHLPTDKVDHAVGFLNHVKLGQRVKKGDLLLTIQHHSHQQQLAQEMRAKMVQKIFKIEKKQTNKLPNLIEEVEYCWADSKESR